MTDVVIAYCVNDQNEVLIAQRPKEPFKDFYECPGGKREAHESLLEALNRELLEELGSTIEESLYIFQYDVLNPHGQFRMHWFKVKLKDPIQSNFYQKILWVQQDQVLNYPWIQHNLPHMKAIHNACEMKAQSFTVYQEIELDQLLKTPNLKEKIHLKFDGFKDNEFNLKTYKSIITEI